MIYLDNAGTSKPLEPVLSYFNETAKNFFGNPSSLHRLGLDAANLLDESRKKVASLCGGTKDSIYFTSGGTEANNLAVLGSLLPKKNPQKVLVSAIEHPSILETRAMVERLGHEFDTISVLETGSLDLDELKRKLSPNTALVSVMTVNNETGTVQPMKEILDIVRSFNKDIIIHSDMVQALGKIPVNLKDLGIDLASFSAHKIGGFKGAGALYVKSRDRIKNISFGGEQEGNLRSGTENVSGIAAFAKACETVLDSGVSDIKEYKSKITGILEKEGCEFRVNSLESGSPYILNLGFKNFRGEVIVHALEEEKIYISTGSACSSKKKQYSDVLKAMGVSDRWNRGSIRISFSRSTTIDECEKTGYALAAAYKKLKPFMK